MSKYTTEVRFVCETLTGEDSMKGYNDMERIVNEAAPLIFQNYPIFDENYRNVLNTKILRHFYTREIGFETIALWKYKLNAKMYEIMPGYNIMYKAMAQLDNVNLFDDTDLNTKHDGNEKTNTEENTEFNSNSEDNRITHSHTDRKNDNSSSDTTTVDVNGSHSNTNVNNAKTQLHNVVTDASAVDTNVGTNTTSTTNNEHTSSTKTRNSDTPQGTISNLESDKYLSNASIVDGEDGGTSTTRNTGAFDDNHTKVQNSGTVTTDTTSNFDDNESRTTDDGWNSSATRSNDVSSSSDTGFDDTNATDKNTNETSHKNQLNRGFDSVDAYLNHVYGKSGGQSYLELMGKIRENILNIDALILNDLEELFMQLW